MLLATLLVLASFADTHIHGVVRDSASRAPLHGAVVRMMEVGKTSSVPIATNKGAVTDRTGSFHVHDVEGDSVQLRVSFIGYATALVPLRLKGDEHELHVEILLAPSSVRGADVVVSAE
ncbi:MAG: carboxypeptidase-like regulatory domain-containing protein, partial [Candidatus Kapaibacterium sp.]